MTVFFAAVPVLLQQCESSINTLKEAFFEVPLCVPLDGRAVVSGGSLCVVVTESGMRQARSPKIQRVPDFLLGPRGGYDAYLCERR